MAKQTETLYALEHNIETGEIIERELNEHELAARAEAIKTQAEAENAAAAREAALTKLEALGLTLDEIKALVR